MKKILSLLIIGLSIVTATISFAGETVKTASDAQLQNTIRALGIMSGYKDGDLKLNFRISRAEFAQMMVNASVLKAVAQAASALLFSAMSNLIIGLQAQSAQRQTQVGLEAFLMALSDPPV